MDAVKENLIHSRWKQIEIAKRLNIFNSDCGRIFAIHIRFGRSLFTKILPLTVDPGFGMMEWMYLFAFISLMGSIDSICIVWHFRYEWKKKNKWKRLTDVAKWFAINQKKWNYTLKERKNDQPTDRHPVDIYTTHPSEPSNAICRDETVFVWFVISHTVLCGNDNERVYRAHTRTSHIAHRHIR